MRLESRVRRFKEKLRHLRRIASIGPGCDPVLGPQEVMVDFCHACNLHCLCCYNYSPLSPPRFSKEERMQSFPRDLFIRLLDDCASLGVGHLSLAGYGEPLAHPECGSLLREIKNRRLRASICTNGTLIPKFPEVVELLDSATVSMQAGSEEGYRAMHPADAAQSWQRSLEGLRLLREGGVPTTLAVILCSENVADLPAAIDLAARFGANLWIQPLRPFIRKQEGHPEFDESKLAFLQMSEAALSDLASRSGEIADSARRKGVSIYGLTDVASLAAGRTGAPDEEVVSRRLGAYYVSHPCYIGWLFARVLVDGSVTPCCQCVGGITLGNIRERSFSDIWRSAEYRWFREETLRMPLQKTAVWRSCVCPTCDSVQRNRRADEILRGRGMAGRACRVIAPFVRRRSAVAPAPPSLRPAVEPD